MRQVFYSSPWIHEPEPEELFRIYAAYGERIKVKAGVDLPYSGEDALVCYLEKGLGAFLSNDKFKYPTNDKNSDPGVKLNNC